MVNLRRTSFLKINTFPSEGLLLISATSSRNCAGFGPGSLPSSVFSILLLRLRSISSFDRLQALSCYSLRSRGSVHDARDRFVRRVAPSWSKLKLRRIQVFLKNQLLFYKMALEPMTKYKGRDDLLILWLNMNEWIWIPTMTFKMSASFDSFTRHWWLRNKNTETLKKNGF